MSMGGRAGVSCMSRHGREVPHRREGMFFPNLFFSNVHEYFFPHPLHLHKYLVILSISPLPMFGKVAICLLAKFPHYNMPQYLPDFNPSTWLVLESSLLPGWNCFLTLPGWNPPLIPLNPYLVPGTLNMNSNSSISCSRQDYRKYTVPTVLCGKLVPTVLHGKFVPTLVRGKLVQTLLCGNLF